MKNPRNIVILVLAAFVLVIGVLLVIKWTKPDKPQNDIFEDYILKDNVKKQKEIEMLQKEKTLLLNSISSIDTLLQNLEINEYHITKNYIAAASGIDTLDADGQFALLRANLIKLQDMERLGLLNSGVPE